MTENDRERVHQPVYDTIVDGLDRSSAINNAVLFGNPTLSDQVSEQRQEIERLRAALRDIRERARTDHVLRFDDGSILLADYITEVLEKEKP